MLAKFKSNERFPYLVPVDNWTQTRKPRPNPCLWSYIDIVPANPRKFRICFANDLRYYFFGIIIIFDEQILNRQAGGRVCDLRRVAPTEHVAGLVPVQRVV
jgi:hypothetical protein